MPNKDQLEQLALSLEGELFLDDLRRTLYATDASVYRKLPMGVAYPKDSKDIAKIILFCQEYGCSLIPRTAGTSLAGQCVGEGLVVDVSRYMTKILDFNEKEKTIWVEPGIIRDELNIFLKPYGLFFGPNTSTSNRCMIGGMVGNNSSGTTSIQNGVTRDKVLEIEAILSDGSTAKFGSITKEEWTSKVAENNLEGSIYKSIYDLLSPKEVQAEIVNNFPNKSIHRRCTGYAIDELIDTDLFNESETEFNLSKLLCGSEGTLAFSTRIKLKLDDLPPANGIMIAAHFEGVPESLKAVVLSMKYDLYTCELMDKIILDCTKNNVSQKKNRFFLEGDPHAILMLEVRDDDGTKVEQKADRLIEALKKGGHGYAYPKLYGGDIVKINELRKAGLGLLGNIVGDRKAVACIEDTAVSLQDLPGYIDEFTQLMDQYNQQAVYYAHAGAGEIHLRPILNLKKKADVQLFRKITTETAQLVKKYGGSFSGEHGDGIVRAEFIPQMIGQKNYNLLVDVKRIWDSNSIFNPGKITNAPPMDESLRYEVDREEPEISTLMDFSDSMGILRAAEKCNGSGDCRKLSSAGGTMCPSYRGTRDEKDTTRARANVLREYLTNSDKVNRFNHEEIKDVMALCLSCKACASECPSSVDVASLKAEFLYQYQKANGISLRTKLFAYNSKLNALAIKVPALSNFIFSSSITAPIIKKISGIAPERSLPKVGKLSLRAWYGKNASKLIVAKPIKTIYLFCDEFTNYLDVQVGIDTFQLLYALGYQVLLVDHEESGRTFISKGLLDEAKLCVDKNIAAFRGVISKDTPLIGLEPSAILSFRDEYLRLATDVSSAKTIAEHTFMVEEFIKQEVELGNIRKDQFTYEKAEIKVHGHCHQKSLSSVENTFFALNLPVNYKVAIIPSGCCGMAGSFGYEKENYSLSMKIGEQTLFPVVRKASNKAIIAAPGTSCRHQIFDGTKRTALHPVTVLKNALN